MWHRVAALLSCTVPEARERIRFVLLSHDNDGVTKFGAGLLSQRPSWLGPNRPPMQEVPGRSPRGIPASMRWRTT